MAQLPKLIEASLESFFLVTLSISSFECRIVDFTFVVLELIIQQFSTWKFDAHFSYSSFFVYHYVKLIAELTFQKRQRLDFTVLLVDVEARADLSAILFDERRSSEIHTFRD